MTAAIRRGLPKALSRLAVRGRCRGSGIAIDLRAGNRDKIANGSGRRRNHRICVRRGDPVHLLVLHVPSKQGDGELDPDAFRAALRPDTALVSVMLANNETGVLFPIEEIGQIVRERSEAVFHVAFRTPPFGGGYAVACGLSNAIEYVKKLQFGDGDLAYLAQQQGNDGKALFDRAFLVHYRTDAVNFLDPPDAFLDALDAPVEHSRESEVEAEPLLGAADRPTVALLAPPLPTERA